jgi:hypothetical protein
MTKTIGAVSNYWRGRHLAKKASLQPECGLLQLRRRRFSWRVVDRIVATCFLGDRPFGQSPAVTGMLLVLPDEFDVAEVAPLGRDYGPRSWCGHCGRGH